MAVKCERCGREVPDAERYDYLGQELCEDCYIDMRSPAKACDPWAVYIATKAREARGLSETAGLTGLQRAIYGLIKNRGKATRENMTNALGITDTELAPQLAILRHCELVKGHKEDGRSTWCLFPGNSSMNEKGIAF
jgi:hypothetical protein